MLNAITKFVCISFFEIRRSLLRSLDSTIDKAEYNKSKSQVTTTRKHYKITKLMKDNDSMHLQEIGEIAAQIFLLQSLERADSN